MGLSEDCNRGKNGRMPIQSGQYSSKGVGIVCPWEAAGGAAGPNGMCNGAGPIPHIPAVPSTKDSWGFRKLATGLKMHACPFEASKAKVRRSLLWCLWAAPAAQGDEVGVRGPQKIRHLPAVPSTKVLWGFQEGPSLRRFEMKPA